MKLGDVAEKIRRMLAIAARPDGGRLEAESAMLMANRLMKKYNLNREDIKQIEDSNEFDLSKVEFYKESVLRRSSRDHRWEGALGNFISEFIPTVGYYHSKELPTNPKLNKHGQLIHHMCTVFYGPIEDVKLATELFRQTYNSAYTYAMEMYGGWTRGKGGSFCQGFVDGLEEAYIVVDSEEQIEEDSNTSLIVTNMAVAVVDASKDWLGAKHGIHLKSGRGLGGVKSKDKSAYETGKLVGGKQSLSTAKKITN